jgi:translocation and assembly module TamB
MPDEAPPPRPPVPIRPTHGRRGPRIVAGLAGVLVLLFVAGAVALFFIVRSAAFHDYVLRTAQEKASTALHTPVHLQNFSLKLSTLTLDLWGLTVEGAGPGAGQPLLQADHAELDVNIISLLRRQWYVNNIAIDHPVVKLMVNGNGETNLPTLSESNSQSNTDVFDLGIRHLLLERGEVYYNDQKSPLYADLHDLRLQSSYDTTGGGRYYGAVGYRDGHLKYGIYEPITHDLQAQFDARRAGLALNNVTLTTPVMVAKLDAAIRDYRHPSGHADYSITFDGGEARRFLNNLSLPIGQVLVNGTADYAGYPNQPLLNTITARGDVSSTELLVRTPQLNTTIRNFGAQFQLAAGNATVQNLHAGLLGGEITGQATVQDLSGEGEGRATVNLKNISLAALKTVANTQSLQDVSLRGEVNGQAVATWNGTMQNLVVRTDAAVNSTAASAQPAAATAQSIPVNGAIHAVYNSAKQSLALNHSYLRTPETTLNLNGAVGNQSALRVNLQVNNLAELERVANMFSHPKPGQPAPAPLGLNGRMTFNGTVSRSISAPQLQGRLTGSDVQVHGTSFSRLQADIDAGPAHATIANAVLQPAGQGQLNFSLQAGLKNWSFTSQSPLSATVNARNVAVAPLVKAANVTTPISGTLNANIDVHGSQENPIGHGTLSLTNAGISGQPIQAVNVDFQGTGDVVNSSLLVRTAAGNATGKLAYYPRNQGYDAALQATGIQLAKLQALRERNLGIAGTLNLTASGRGTLNDPQGQASLAIPQLTLRDQQVRDVNLQANVAGHRGNFNLAAQVLNAPLRVQGNVALTGDYYAEAQLDTPVIALQPLLATYAPAQAADVSGQTEIHATLRGPLKNRQLLEGHLNVPTLNLQYQQARIAAVRPIVADYANGVLTVQPGQIQGTGTDIRFAGRLPLTGNVPSSVTLLGNVDLALAHMLNPDINSEGQLQFDVNAQGHAADQNVKGQIRIVNAGFSTSDAPLELSEANGVLTLHSDRLEISQFAGKVGGGAITATGGVIYRPKMQFDVTLKGAGIRMLYPQGLRSDLGLQLTMTGTPDASLLSGVIDLNRLTFTPDFDLISFSSQFSGDSTPPASEDFANTIKLNIAVRTPNELNAYSSKVSLQGNANLRLTGTANNPVILGRSNLTGGELFLMGNRYLVQGGTVAFVNTVRTEPVLNLQVNTTIQQYNVAMRFQGPLDRLHTNYTSDPALPPADIINLIAFGKTQEAQAAQSQPGNLGAESLVASTVSSQVTGRLEKIAGISHLSVDPVLGGNGNQNPGARVTIQQRVTSKLYVTFATDVTQTQTQEVQLEYHVNRKWSVSGNRDQNGGFGVDGRYHKDF